MNAGSTPLLCPFFGKCDGVLLVNAADGSKEFHPRDRSGAKSMCDLLLELKPGQVICGFIGKPEKQKLSAAGIDVRVGSCSCPIDELVASFSGLPMA
ncbi:NifB/NifX family molybdenum-iron cluster-binding protein [Roseiarcaceae bacterium H3SJ34-1]|uniref:NifB/NifX family molybdenum-iron cluster-binding protein n=1 Tax=Terripilifer ovatus TaxID=3032367 RepID=UPI003AB9B002|nr:NifB/NifX family molybdenum-iron cluster-binding protein [Roseiarcaceae bacterium H3SJ34-1]